MPYTLFFGPNSTKIEKCKKLQKSILKRFYMEIQRDFYLDKLIKRKNNCLIKIITGIRRCGKSYLLNTIFYHHLIASGVPADHIIRFAFDSADDLYLIGENLIQYCTNNKRKYFRLETIALVK